MLSTAAYLQNPTPLALAPQRSIHLLVTSSVSSASYTILAQSRDELIFPDHSPSISMWPYLQRSAQTRRLNQISVYTGLGTSREQTRLLYMNAAALRLWREMGMPISVVGEISRPPRTALLSFGMPFSE